MLEPDLIDHAALPVREQTDAVGPGHDFIEVLIQFGHGQIFVDVLLHQICGFRRQGHSGYNAKSSQRYNRSFENLPVLFKRKRLQLTVSRHHLQSDHRRSQVAVPVARTVCSRRAGAGHRNVWE